MTIETAEDAADIDIEQVLRDVLTPMLAQLEQKFSAQIQQAVEERLSQNYADTDGDEAEDATVQALQKRLALMEAKAKESEEKQAQAARDSYLTKIAQENGAEEVELAKLALSHRLGELVATKDSGYLTKDGKSPEDVAKEFFASSAGMRLLPSSVKPGSGVVGGKAPRTTGAPEKSTEEMLLSFGL